MAEIVAMSGKGKRKGGGAGKTAKLAELAVLAELDVAAGEESGTGKTRKSRVRGYGVDRLRRAAERRMAESSEALAESLMSKALEGRLESVKFLMQLAEEEKARKEEDKDHMPEIYAALGFKMVEPEVGDVWVGKGWKKVETGEFVGGTWEGLKAA